MLDVFRGFGDLRGEIARMLDERLGGLVRRSNGLQGAEPESWLPLVDVLRRDGDLVIRAELPGLKKEDVDVSLSERVLTISGRREDESEKRDGGYYVRERRYGSFSRSLVLPEGVDEGKIGARFENGVLEVTVADAVAVREPRHIQIEG